jgi:hypothetical protein
MDKVAPPELQAIAEETNARIHPFVLEPYLQYDSDGPDNWRFRLLDMHGTELTRYIFPDRADPHTLARMVDAMKAWGHHCSRSGKDDAVNKLAAHFKTIVHKL